MRSRTHPRTGCWFFKDSNLKLRKGRKSNPGQLELTKEGVLKEVEHHVERHTVPMCTSIHTHRYAHAQAYTQVYTHTHTHTHTQSH